MHWLLANGRTSIATVPWIATFAELAIALSVLACKFLGDMPRGPLDRV